MIKHLQRWLHTASLTRLTLGKRVVFLTVAGILLGGSVFAYLSIQATNRSTQAMLQERLTTANLIATYADEVLARASREVEDTAIAISTVGQDEAASKLGAMESAFSRMSLSVVMTLLLAEDGRVLWASDHQAELAGTRLADYAAPGYGGFDSQPHISDVVPAPMAQTPAVLLTSRTLPQETGGTRILVVAIDVARSSIGGFIQPVELGKTGYVEIVDQNGVVIARTEPGREIAPFEKSDHPERFAELIRTGEASVGTCHTCHIAEKQTPSRRDVLAFSPLSSAPWGVVIRQSEEEALAPVRDLRRELLVAGLGLLATALVFVGASTRSVVRRIGALSAACMRVAKGDLTSPVTPLGSDEIGALARSFDDMRANLRRSYADLELRTKELSSLLEVSSVLASTHDLPALLDAVVSKSVDVISAADGGVLFLSNGDSDGLRVHSAVGLDAALLSKLEAACGEMSAVSAGNLADQVCKAVSTDDTAPSPIQSAICAPIVHRGRRSGGLVLVSRQHTDAFTASDDRLLAAIADYIAIAVERVRLTAEAEEAAALREADRLKSNFISSISHELRTPLTSIQGYATSLLRSDIDWDEATKKEFLEVIDEKATELRNLIDKLLQMARLEGGILTLDKEPVLVQLLAAKVAKEARARTRKHEVVTQFPEDMPVVEVDVLKITQVLNNLVENAIKYSPDGGRVTISGGVQDGVIVVSVRDQGVGIPAEHGDSIFRRFYRVDSPLTRSTQGTGLGLAISKAHVEAHGGKIWFESVVGQGSTFYFSLPLKAGLNGEEQDG